MLAWETAITQLIEAGDGNVTLKSKHEILQDYDEEDAFDDEGL